MEDNNGTDGIGEDTPEEAERQRFWDEKYRSRLDALREDLRADGISMVFVAHLCRRPEGDDAVETNIICSVMQIGVSHVLDKILRVVRDNHETVPPEMAFLAEMIRQHDTPRVAVVGPGGEDVDTCPCPKCAARRAAATAAQADGARNVPAQQEMRA